MQVHADALSLLQPGDALRLVVELGVADGDGGLGGQEPNELFVVVAEATAAGLVGQVEVADDAAAED